MRSPKPAAQVFARDVPNVATMELSVEGEPFQPHRVIDGSGCLGMVLITDQDGPMWTLQCAECREEWGYPALRRDPERLKAHRLEHSGIPLMFRGRDFDSGVKGQQAALKACREWLGEYRPPSADRPGSGIPAPALYGDVGRGKSHLLCVVVEALIQTHGVRALYRSAVQFYDELQAAIGTDGYDAVWERVVECDVLALDDLSAERGTDWQRERLAALVDHRYSRQLPIVLATNVGPDEWEATFGDRAASRLRGMTVPVLLAGPDHRYRGQQTTLGVAE